MLKKGDKARERKSKMLEEMDETVFYNNPITKSLVTIRN